MKVLSRFALFLLAISLLACKPEQKETKYSISLTDGIIQEPIDGRLFLLISSNDAAEPRFQVSDDPGTQLVYGMDVEGVDTNIPVEFDLHSPVFRGFQYQFQVPGNIILKTNKNYFAEMENVR